MRLPSSPIQVQNLSGGELWQPDGAPVVDVVSPYTGTVIGRVPLSSAAHVDRVVRAAAEAAPGWRGTPVKERCARLFKFRELLEANLEDLSHTVAAESGKTLGEARAGLQKGIECVEFATGIQNMDTGGSLEVSRGVFCEVKREPLGVVAGITPFNFPAMVPMWMFPIALAVGNVFVLKPSEKVPLTSLRLAALLAEAGLPKGVFSLVQGAKEAAEALATHPLVAAVAFVGSTPVAKHLYALATAEGKRALALGGAKNHLIVAPDADRDLTAQAVVDSFTGCAGQRCMAGSVMVAVGDVSAIVEEVKRRAGALELGTNMGAIIDDAALERIRKAIAVAEGEGARVLVDGREKRPAEGAYARGHWIGPTVLDGVQPAMGVWKTEVFGPVLSIVRVKSLGEAIALENASPYGNAASIFTTSGAVAAQVVDRVGSGMVGINVGVPVPREPFSFGGTKASRFGHGDITGPAGVEFWSSLKKITRKWSAATDATWMS